MTLILDTRIHECLALRRGHYLHVHVHVAWLHSSPIVIDLAPCYFSGGPPKPAVMKHRLLSKFQHSLQFVYQVRPFLIACMYAQE